MTKFRDIAIVCILAATAAFYCFYNLGQASIGFKHDERTHVTVVQQMLHSGDLTNPQLNGRLYFNKPPLKMWLSLIPLTIFGESNFTYRVLDGVAGVLTVICTYFLGIYFFNSRWIGFLAALILLANKTFLFERIIRHAVQDSFLVLLSTIAAYVLYRGWETNRRGLMLLGGIIVGAAVLCKSVAGYTVLILWSIAMVLNALAFNGLSGLVSAALLVPWIGAIAVPALWFVPHFLIHGAALVKNVNHEVVGRVTEGYHQVGRPVYYVEHLFFRRAFSPWFPFIAGLIMPFVHRVSLTPKVRWVLIWAVGTLIGYSILPSRSLHYLAPCFVAMALVSAYGLTLLFTLLFRRWFIVRMLAVIGILFSTFQIGRDLRGTTLRTMEPRSPIGIDFLLQLIRASSGTLSIAFAPNVQFTEREALYRTMLTPYTKEYAAHPDIFVTTLTDARSIGENFRFFFVLPAVHERSEVLVALSHRELAGFTPIVRTFDSPLTEVKPVYGWGQERMLGSVGVRLVEKPVAVIAFHSDEFSNLITTTIRINAMFDGSSTEPSNPVELFLNGASLGEQSFRRGALVTQAWPVRPDQFIVGENTLSLAVRYPPLYLNWLQITPASQVSERQQSRAQ